MTLWTLVHVYWHFVLLCDMQVSHIINTYLNLWLRWVQLLLSQHSLVWFKVVPTYSLLSCLPRPKILKQLTPPAFFLRFLKSFLKVFKLPLSRFYVLCLCTMLAIPFLCQDLSVSVFKHTSQIYSPSQWGREKERQTVGVEQSFVWIKE